MPVCSFSLSARLCQPSPDLRLPLFLQSPLPDQIYPVLPLPDLFLHRIFPDGAIVLKLHPAASHRQAAFSFQQVFLPFLLSPQLHPPPVILPLYLQAVLPPFHHLLLLGALPQGTLLLSFLTARHLHLFPELPLPPHMSANQASLLSRQTFFQICDHIFPAATESAAYTASSAPLPYIHTCLH